MSMLKLLRALLASLLFAGSASAAVISVGVYPVNPTPGHIPTLPTGAFLLPVEIEGVLNLQTWQFDLLFDSSVVQVVDPFDGSSGIYGAEFTAGNPLSLSFILGGFPLNSLGLVDDVAGFYPDLLIPPSGDGILAYVLFGFLPGQANNDPRFRIDNAVLVSQVPEPGPLSLVALGLLLVAAPRVSRREVRRSSEPAHA